MSSFLFILSIPKSIQYFCLIIKLANYSFKSFKHNKLANLFKKVLVMFLEPA